MPIALNGFEVFEQVGKHANLFAPIRADVDKQARALLVKCLKHKSIGLDVLRDVREALGTSQFGLILEGLKDAEVKSVVTRLDKHHPELKKSSAGWRRDHLNALADGSALPSPAPTKAKASTAKKSKTTPSRLKSDVVDVYKETGKKSS
ncbi:conserved protein of unknown function [Bradyrhizobium sp. ORS 285]|uniref:hypothetical protein n=1 Tax=Bradyrhizobium sp. ORS 285 TaxID=115808 RepID=UPI0002406815|nr:hypothetical protein [Bradyrhizobium sp. ORS 285]CCD88416.1 conserved hypothetical protein [Bradyrhizobium sp. ORS 285]SMX56833.1 conserved protein of unknown function [Bradyrhizobium sp. ORS 285]